MSQPHAIFFVVDEELADLAGAAALQMSSLWDCDFHIFVERRDPACTLREIGGGRIRYHYDRLARFLPAGLPEFGRWPRIVYLRLFAPQLLTGYRRVLYLDADTLAFEGDPAIWDVPLPSGLGAVDDLGLVATGPEGCDRAAWLRGIGVTSGRYANSGVLLIDPALWVGTDFAAALSRFFAAFPGASYPDQDFLAHHFDGRWTPLSPRFNWQGVIMHLGLTRAIRPVFGHFNTAVRPWQGQIASWMDRNDPAYIGLYARVLRQAGLRPDRYRPALRLVPLRALKHAGWRWMGQRGWFVPREDGRRADWWDEHRALRAHIETGLAEGRFAAEPRRAIDVAPPRLFWDGRFVRVAGDMPEADPLARQ